MRIAYIGMGANLPSRAGQPEATLAAALPCLEKLGRVKARSGLYSTAPVGLAKQPRFLNAVAALETMLAPHALLDELMKIEHGFGRSRVAAMVNGPRTLDLDLLLYGDAVICEAGLIVPHPRLAERAFVLVPLREIAPELREPRTGCTVTQLLEKLLPDLNDPTHAVVPLQSDVWRAGAADGSQR